MRCCRQRQRRVYSGKVPTVAKNSRCHNESAFLRVGECRKLMVKAPKKIVRDGELCLNDGSLRFVSGEEPCFFLRAWEKADGRAT